MSPVVLYSRPRCPLCDKARQALEEARISFQEVDISRDQALEAEYGIFIPVVEVAGRVVFEAGMDPNALPDLIVGPDG
ncbi:MAG: glutaredoxin family protein [Actinomycetota bacterium]